jgi:regulation of enolase protein 1 (concanavalin A-like superfamily)
MTVLVSCFRCGKAVLARKETLASKKPAYCSGCRNSLGLPDPSEEEAPKMAVVRIPSARDKESSYRRPDPENRRPRREEGRSYLWLIIAGGVLVCGFLLLGIFAIIVLLLTDGGPSQPATRKPDQAASKEPDPAASKEPGLPAAREPAQPAGRPPGQPAARPPGQPAGKKPGEAREWGQVIDPDGDCTIAEQNGKLIIRVPGTLHDLSPEQKDARKRTNAPRVVKEVQGDFVATVKVTADWNPGGKLPGASTLPYNGAGLLLFISDTHFLRLERNVFVGANGLVCFTTPLYYAQGRLANQAMSTQGAFYQGRSTWLKMERAGARLTTAISHDGQVWIETATLTGNLPESVAVGLEAINSSNKEFLVEFEEFKVASRR